MLLLAQKGTFKPSWLFLEQNAFAKLSRFLVSQNAFAKLAFFSFPVDFCNVHVLAFHSLDMSYNVKFTCYMKDIVGVRPPYLAYFI